GDCDSRLQFLADKEQPDWFARGGLVSRGAGTRASEDAGLGSVNATWHRRESRSDRASDRRSASDACCRRYAAASQARAGAAAPPSVYGPRLLRLATSPAPCSASCTHV